MNLVTQCLVASNKKLYDLLTKSGTIYRAVLKNKIQSFSVLCTLNVKYQRAKSHLFTDTLNL